MSNGGRPSTKRRPQKRRITDDEKNKIAARIKEGRDGDSCSQIARDFGRSKSTVSKIAKDRGLSFERAQTKHATEAKKADNAVRLVELQGRFLEETQKALDELHAPALVFNWHQGEFHTDEIAAPDFKAKRDIMWRAGSAIRNFLEIDNRGTSGEEPETALEAFWKAAREEGERRDG